MTSSTACYHDSPFSEQSILAELPAGLETDAKIADNLVAFLKRDASAGEVETIHMLRGFRDQSASAAERHRTRIERLATDPTMIDELRNYALVLIIALPISRYLATVRPGIVLWREEDTYHGPCPYAHHHLDEDSFRIFGDDYAWCRSCGGGNLFRVIGLVEVLPSPHDQVRRAAEIAGLEQPRALRPRTSRSNTFQPIQIVNGRVAP
jgi:hypothetical protein